MTEETKDQATPDAKTENAPQFGIQRIYVKDMSFESPNRIDSATQWKPKINQDLNTQVDGISKELFEVTIKLTITVTLEGDKVAFLAEIHQAGLFHISGIEGPQLQHAVTAACPQILFPYAREAIDNMAVKGGFPPVALPPINFDALYLRAMEEAKTRENSDTTTGETH